MAARPPARGPPPPWPGPAAPARGSAGSGVSQSRPGLSCLIGGCTHPRWPGRSRVTGFAGLSHQAPGTWSGRGGSWGCPCHCPHSWGTTPHAPLSTSPHPLWKLSLSSYLPVSPSLLGTSAPSSHPSLTISRPSCGQQEPGRALSRQGTGTGTGGDAHNCSQGLGAPEALGRLRPRTHSCRVPGSQGLGSGPSTIHSSCHPDLGQEEQGAGAAQEGGPGDRTQDSRQGCRKPLCCPP